MQHLQNTLCPSVWGCVRVLLTPGTRGRRAEAPCIYSPWSLWASRCRWPPGRVADHRPAWRGWPPGSRYLQTHRECHVSIPIHPCLHVLLELLRSLGREIMETNRVKHKRPFCLVTYILNKAKKKRNTGAVCTTVQIKHELYSIRAISINTYWLRTHLSNRGWGFALLSAAGIMFTHTYAHPSPCASPRKVG